MTEGLPVPTRALAVGAHPDDVEFRCGGTIAKWAAAGCDVHLLIITDGSKGSWEPDEDVAALIETRQREAQEAAGTLGAADVHFLNLVDGELDTRLAHREAVARVIRRTRPDVVLGHDPWKRYRLHPDHRHAGFLTADGVVAARDPHFFPDAELPHHRPEELLLFEAQEPDHFEPLTEEHVRTKVAALLCHRSQWRSTMGIGDSEDEREEFAARIRQKAREAGQTADLPLAEAFKRLGDI